MRAMGKMVRAAVRLGGLFALIAGAVVLARAALVCGIADEWSIVLWTLSLVLAGLALVLLRGFLLEGVPAGLRYLRWLLGAYLRCAGLIVRHPWIWAPGLASVTIGAGLALLSQWSWHRPTAPALPVTFQPQPPMVYRVGAMHLPVDLPHLWPPSWDTTISRLAATYPRAPFGQAVALLAVAYLIFAARVPRLLESVAGIARRRARWWNALFILGACATVLMEATVIWWQLPEWGFLVGRASRSVQRWAWVWLYAIGPIGALPFGALVQAVFFTMVLRVVRGQPLSLREVVNRAFTCMFPLLCLSLIVLFIWLALLVASEALIRRWGSYDATFWIVLWIRRASEVAPFIQGVAAMIVVSDGCHVGAAFVRFGEFVRRYFWRIVGFVVVGAIVLILPGVLFSARFNLAEFSIPAVRDFLLIEPAIRTALGLLLTVTWFEFYRTNAGTAAQVPSAEAQGQETFA